MTQLKGRALFEKTPSTQNCQVYSIEQPSIFAERDEREGRHCRANNGTVKMYNLRVGVDLGVIPSLQRPAVIGTSFIDLFVKCVDPSE